MPLAPVLLVNVAPRGAGKGAKVTALAIGTLRGVSAGVDGRVTTLNGVSVVGGFGAAIGGGVTGGGALTRAVKMVVSWTNAS